MKKPVITIFNFIRQSHEEPTRFIKDDLDTLKNQIIVLKKHQLPATFALKYDALLEPRYTDLLKEYLDEEDEISVWLEITSELCEKAKVPFPGNPGEGKFSNRVATAYSIGYKPEERFRLLDVYMQEFHKVFGGYPSTIASWILDIKTIRYAKEVYGVIGAAICRDQVGVDGFTLWGGYPSSAYYPSKKNEFIPAQTASMQVDVPVFRLLGPDPIYNWESEEREGINGVYSLEPSCAVGKDPVWIQWMLERLTEEDNIGFCFAQVGQENNFLWENMRRGYQIQLKEIALLRATNQVRTETLARAAIRFQQKYPTTPPMTYQASRDWNEVHNLKTIWYASKHYRISFLFDHKAFYIRDWFVYQEDYVSRYEWKRLEKDACIFDALPMISADIWTKCSGTQEKQTKKEEQRSCGYLCEENGKRLQVETLLFQAVNETQSRILIKTKDQQEYTVFLTEEEVVFHGKLSVEFTFLPTLSKWNQEQLHFLHEDFPYQLTIKQGILSRQEAVGEEHHVILLQSQKERIQVRLVQKEQGDWSFLTGKGVNGEETEEIKKSEIKKSKETKRVKEIVVESKIEEKAIDLTIHGLLSSKKVYDPNEFQLIERDITYTYERLLMTVLEDNTVWDPRKLLNHDGAKDLLREGRGSLDYQDGNWLGTTEDIEVLFELQKKQRVKQVHIGFLSNHRSGILFPKEVTICSGVEKDNLTCLQTVILPNQRGEHEIEQLEVNVEVEKEVQFIRVHAKNHERFPNWCMYRGEPGVFLMVDRVIVE